MTKKGKILTEGKTKWIFEVKGHSELVWIKYKNTITKNDDPSLTREFETKALLSNTVNAEVFSLLKRAEIPVAFVKKISSTEFIAQKCEMIGLEVVTRRFAVGSYLKRNPDFKVLEGINPKRFDKIVVEFFLKTTKGKLVNSSGKLLIDGLDPKKGEEDPFIPNPNDKTWNLYHPKKTERASDVLLGTVQRIDVVGEDDDIMSSMVYHAREVFLVLEAAFNTLKCRFIDMKIEFGINKKGELVISDVIDNDSWRLRTLNWQRLSKETFRQNESFGNVVEKYAIVTDLVQCWEISNRLLIFWKGLEKVLS